MLYYEQHYYYHVHHVERCDGLVDPALAAELARALLFLHPHLELLVCPNHVLLALCQVLVYPVDQVALPHHHHIHPPQHDVQVLDLGVYFLKQFAPIIALK